MRTPSLAFIYAEPVKKQKWFSFTTVILQNRIDSLKKKNPLTTKAQDLWSPKYNMPGQYIILMWSFSQQCIQGLTSLEGV